MLHLTEDLRRFIERIFAESVLPLLVDGKPWATGFFVSDDGLLCSCHHGLDPGFPGRVEVSWKGKTYPLVYLPAESSPALDFALFRLEPASIGLEKVIPVPVQEGGVDPLRPGAAALALGYAGMTDPLAPLRLRAFEGAVTAVALYGNPATGHALYKFETLDLTVGKGNSGAPVLDLQTFRIIGYVQGKLEGVWERMGRASLLEPLVEGQPQLHDVWIASGERFDAEKRRFFKENGQRLPIELLTPADARALAAEHNRAVTATLQRAGIYNADLFVTRSVSQSIDRFLAAPEPPLALLAGQSGTGKTNVLVDVCRRVSDSKSIVILILCSALDSTDSLDTMPARLQVDGDLNIFLRREAPERVLLILDGYNEWASASRTHLLHIIDRVGELARGNGLPLKVLIGVKTEFIREHVHELFLADRQEGGTAESQVPVDLLFHDRDVSYLGTKDAIRAKAPLRPFIEVPTLDSGEGASSEQAAIYERYRSLRTIRDAAGHDVGICPLTAYEDVPDTIRKLLDRPLLLRQFMIRYDRQQVPSGGLRSSLFREILTPNISRFAPSWITREAVEVLLGNLARHLSQLGYSSLPFRQLVREPWFDRVIIELLLAHTFFLARSATPGSLIGASALGFSSEWLFEYYLALDLWEELVIVTGSRIDYLNASLRSSAEGNVGHVAGALTFVGEWALTGNHALLLDLLVSAPEDDLQPLRRAFIASFFEFVRGHYGFSRPLPPEVLGSPSTFADLLVEWHHQLGPACLRHVLRYLERLGDRGLTDCIELLSLDERLWEDLGATWKEEVIPLRALKRFRMDSEEYVRGAMEDLTRIDRAAAPQEMRSLIAFVTGRCYQWFQNYEAALAAYSECKNARDTYGAMCRHQIAFIRFFQHSDYKGVATLIEEEGLVLRGSKVLDIGATTLLYGHCLIELGRFTEARDLILELVRRRRTAGLGRARALRALVSLYFRTFETSLAIDTAETALKQSRERENQLPYAESRELLAATLACHLGDIPQALEIIAESLAIASKRGHSPSISWFAQTKALIHALARDGEASEEALALAEHASLNPNQVRRSGFIRILGRFLMHRGTARSPVSAEVESLRRDYESAGQSWYAAILRLVSDSLAGRQAPEAASYFPPGTDADGLRDSYLFQVLTGQVVSKETQRSRVAPV
ncbi:MAG TPA: trypsin-like peptidase domain-containing protein [Thermoanaerobaculia bacterium]|nr:trypsin-like peptidase domain-containing protein [Thermoanaerobaculia bacterium]